MSALNDLHEQAGDALPAIVDAATFTATPMPEPPQVVAGVLHRGSKAVYGGPSKAFKTWTLLDLCLAVGKGSVRAYMHCLAEGFNLRSLLIPESFYRTNLHCYGPLSPTVGRAIHH